MKNYLTIDIGGTFIKYAILDKNQQLLALNKQATPINKDNAIINLIIDIITELSVEYSFEGIGISTAGIVNRDAGEIIYAGPTIKDYKGTNFKQALAHFNLPVQVTNDVDAALLGEIWQSNIDQTESTFCLTLGTGIGGALYKNGLQNGVHLQGNSIGYLLYDPLTDLNFEKRASTSALNEQITDYFGLHFTTKKFFERARYGDRHAIDILNVWTKEIAIGIAQIILIHDPTRIIIGGGVSAQGEFLLKYIKELIPFYLPDNFMKTEISTAKQQNNASLFGAVYPFFNSNI